MKDSESQMKSDQNLNEISPGNVAEGTAGERFVLDEHSQKLLEKVKKELPYTSTTAAI